MRKLTDVIDDMMAVIPSDETSLLAALYSTKTSLIVAAPEMESFWWKKCGDDLVDTIPELNEDWHYAIARIFNGQDV